MTRVRLTVEFLSEDDAVFDKRGFVLPFVEGPSSIPRSVQIGWLAHQVGQSAEIAVNQTLGLDRWLEREGKHRR